MYHFVILTLLAVSCSGKNDDSAGEEADTDTDTDADSDADTDADTDTDTTSGPCPKSITDERDDRTYAVVQLDDDCWLAENLDFGAFLNQPKPGSWQIDDKLPQKYCYDHVETNCATLGGLYEWGELMDYSPSDARGRGITQGLCPEGWHLPTDEEWKGLEFRLGMTLEDTDEDGWRGTAMAPILESKGFATVMAGYRDPDGTTAAKDELAGWWTATEDDKELAWDRVVSSKKSQIGRFAIEKANGVSARCVRDATAEIVPTE